MRLEVLCTGDELLGGSVSDTNTAMFANILLDAGVEIARATVVGDALDDIVQALRDVTSRADVVLVCGGLGPTDDDRTTAAVARAAGVSLVTDAEALRRLDERLTSFGRTVTDNNRRQADVPRGARVLQTSVGTAAGYCVQVGGARCYVMPGVPREAQWFCQTYVLPDLLALVPQLVKSRVLRCVGIPESELDQRVAGMTSMFPGVSVHFRTAFPENHLKLVARGRDALAVETALAGAVGEAHRRLGEVVVSDDGRSLPKVLLDVLLARGETLALAESCTGGLVSSWITDVPGSSRVMLGGVVAYANSVKTQLLDVPVEMLRQHGAVSGPVASQMAAGVRARLGATWGLSLTGVAGPDGGTPERPVGTVWMGLAGPQGVEARVLLHKGDRERIRVSAGTSALMMLLRRLVPQPG